MSDDMEDEIEAAYWTFDTERKRSGMERDAFKRPMRKLRDDLLLMAKCRDEALDDADDWKKSFRQAQERADENHAETKRWHAAAQRHANEAERLRKALTELVVLKGYKDLYGKTPEYEERQPQAWAAARKALEESSE